MDLKTMTFWYSNRNTNLWSAFNDYLTREMLAKSGPIFSRPFGSLSVILSIHLYCSCVA